MSSPQSPAGPDVIGGYYSLNATHRTPLLPRVLPIVEATPVINVPAIARDLAEAVVEACGTSIPAPGDRLESEEKTWLRRKAGFTRRQWLRGVLDQTRAARGSALVEFSRDKPGSDPDLRGALRRYAARKSLRLEQWTLGPADFKWFDEAVPAEGLLTINGNVAYEWHEMPLGKIAHDLARLARDYRAYIDPTALAAHYQRAMLRLLRRRGLTLGDEWFEIAIATADPAPIGPLRGTSQPFEVWAFAGRLYWVGPVENEVLIRRVADPITGIDRTHTWEDEPRMTASRGFWIPKLSGDHVLSLAVINAIRKDAGFPPRRLPHELTGGVSPR